MDITAIFSASKPQIPVGAKHDRRQIIAEKKDCRGDSRIAPTAGKIAPYCGSVRKKTAVGLWLFQVRLIKSYRGASIAPLQQINLCCRGAMLAPPR